MSPGASANDRSTSSHGDLVSVLVTGAAGFIGSHLCDRLLAEGHRVWGLDNFDDFYDPARKRENLSGAVDHPSMHLVEGDVRDQVLLDGLMSDVELDAVVHLAARAGIRPSIDNPHLTYDVNVQGTLTLLEGIRRHSVPALLFGSSSAVYGNDADVPNEEDVPADRPLSAYAASKRAAEMLCHTYHYQHNLTVYSVRLPSVFGPRQPPGGPIHRLARLLADGKPVTLPGNDRRRCAYLFIDDAVDGIQRAMNEALTSEPSFRPVEFDRCESQSLSAIVESLAEALGVEANVEYDPRGRSGGHRELQVPENIASETRHDRRIQFDEGLDSFVKWFREEERQSLDSDTVVAS